MQVLVSSLSTTPRIGEQRQWPEYSGDYHAESAVIRTTFTKEIRKNYS